MRILLVASIVSIVIGVSTADDSHRSLAWIEGFAIFIAVFVCCNVTAVNVFEYLIRIIKKRDNSKV
jgi:hypothetical protein